MSYISVKSTYDYNLHYFNETFSFDIGQVELNNLQPVKNINKTDLINTNDVLMSDSKKLLWVFHRSGMYNQFVENFSIFLRAYFENKNKFEYVVLLINKNLHVFPEDDLSYTNFIFKILNDLEIKYYVFETYQKNNEPVYANNFYTIPFISPTIDMIQDLKKIFFKYLSNENIKPFRKVYLSRKHMVPRPYNWIKDGLATKVDNRLIDDDVLEQFLKSIGFDVIIPEYQFKNFEDQVQYMYETKILVSLSSSGLANMLFMQPNTFAFEFLTTHINTIYNNNNSFTQDLYNIENQYDGEELLHNLYWTLCYLNKINYAFLPNYTRFSIDIINQIENNEFLNLIFLGQNKNE